MKEKSGSLQRKTTALCGPPRRDRALPPGPRWIPIYHEARESRQGGIGIIKSRQGREYLSGQGRAQRFIPVHPSDPPSLRAGKGRGSRQIFSRPAMAGLIVLPPGPFPKVKGRAKIVFSRKDYATVAVQGKPNLSPNPGYQIRGHRHVTGYPSRSIPATGRASAGIRAGPAMEKCLAIPAFAPPYTAPSGTGAGRG